MKSSLFALRLNLNGENGKQNRFTTIHKKCVFFYRFSTCCFCIKQKRSELYFCAFTTRGSCICRNLKPTIDFDMIAIYQ